VKGLKVVCELWVRLKVIDLVSQTAWMTLTEKLKLQDTLTGLRHYNYWRILLDGEGIEEVAEEIDRVIRLDSAFVNQNKHFYRLYALSIEEYDSMRSDNRVASLSAISMKGAKLFTTGDLSLDRDYPDTGGLQTRGFIFDCLIRSLDGRAEEGYRKRLNDRLEGCSVEDVVAGEVWRIALGAQDEEDALQKIEGILVTKSRREGLLLNPHYQRYEVLSRQVL